MQSRSGELAMRPLPAVLLDLHDDLATGKLSLRRGRVSKSVDLVNGNPVSTASTPRDETLGHFLVNSGVISEEHHHQAITRASTVGGKLGEALVGLQILTVEQLIEQLGRQARHKLVQALRWPQGAWRFDEAYEPIEGLQLRMLDVVFEGLRETAVEDLGRLSRLDGMSFELTERGRRLRNELKKSLGERPFAALSAGAPISEIEVAYGDRVQARGAIDAMLLCDAIVAKGVQLGLGALPATVRERAASQNELSAQPPAPDGALYDLLFDEDEDEDQPQAPRASTGAAPLEFRERESVDDSGVVSTFELAQVTAHREHDSSTSQAIAAEHARIQGADHYAILLCERDADADDIDAAYQIKLALFDRTAKAATEPRDLAKIEEVRAAYGAAVAALTDERLRAAYNRELAGGELVQVAPAMETELSFRMAEDRMAKKQWAHAIGLLKTVIQRAPNEADYHAALGWAEWNAANEPGQPGPSDTIDVARAHLNHALSINPDHPAAHDYKGRIDAANRADDAGALFHLERAIDLDPARGDALTAVEGLLIARGELRRLERVLKRVLFRLRGKGGAPEASAWIRLAKLYLDHLDDPQAGIAAIANAKRLAPKDAAAIALEKRAAHRSAGAAEPMRAGWREALDDPQSGSALVHTTAAAGHADAAFLAAATMVALGSADDAMTALYEQHRIRDVRLPEMRGDTALGPEQWSLLRHRDDALELGALLELVAPAVHALAPMTLADSELDPSQRLEDGDLPPAFARVRERIGAVLGVAAAPVYARVELGSQIHVVACDPPVLVAGDDALTAPERPELVFRVARALTFLWPGRAVGASRPGRVLRAVVLAIVREATGTELGAEDPLAVKANQAITTLASAAREQARASALRLLSKSGGGLNLSTWARSLSRTADRAGMLLCGDVPAAFAGAREVGELDRDLVEFAYSAAHVALRAQLGLTR